MPKFRLIFTREAARQHQELKRDAGRAKRLRAVNKTLGLLETNPRHPGLNSREYESLIGLNGERVFEVYAENKTPAAFRVFWHYGPGRQVITVIAITKHP
jgi:hypothetical protein